MKSDVLLYLNRAVAEFNISRHWR